MWTKKARGLQNGHNVVKICFQMVKEGQNTVKMVKNVSKYGLKNGWKISTSEKGLHSVLGYIPTLMRCTPKLVYIFENHIPRGIFWHLQLNRLSSPEKLKVSKI